ncbi:MAG TPA: superoxide dismutase family protein [Vicinamibacteria bacterium]|nr:superoxide dismutase family protein [Vicinamibacteria bacterium]
MSNLQQNRFLTLGAVALAAVASLGGAAIAYIVYADEVKDARASAALAPTQGSQVKGTVTFEKQPTGVQVSVQLEGLTPGTHGFHVHEKGDCSAPDGTSAGGHFNPTNQPHAAREAPARHDGDLGNLEADASGKVQIKLIDPKLHLDGPESIVGKAVIVHEKADDYTTQPTGNAGGRVACGVVKAETKGR